MQQLQNDGSYNELLPKADAWTKDETLSAQVASVLGLRDNYKPDDAFLSLYFGAGTYRYRVRVVFEDGTPAQRCTISGISQITGLSLITDEHRYVLGKSISQQITIGCSIPYLDYNKPGEQTVSSSGIITDVIFTLFPINEMITLLSSGTYRFSPFIKKADICIVGGGGQGLYSAYETNEGGYGAAGGWVSQYPITANDIITVSIGGANSSGIDSTDTSIKINNENLVLSMKYEKKISQKYKAGENGFLIFGDSSLGWVGSSGGSGGYSKGYGYDAGLSGRIGAGAGGGAEWPSTADNGGNATGYGCGGGGAGFACNNKETDYKKGNRGSRKQGAAFIRVYR